MMGKEKDKFVVLVIKYRTKEVDCKLMKRKTISSLLCLCMLLTLLPTTALASTNEAVFGSFLVRSAADVSVEAVAEYKNNVLYIKGDCTISMSDYGEMTTTDKIEVISGADIVLDGVNIDFGEEDSYTGCAFRITSDAGPVNITLADGSTNILKSSTGYSVSKFAGLQKDNEAMLTINGSFESYL
ncbi:MAG TPA: hypothetical protein GXX38_10090 [Clostridia bacterium]|nr:hypothetical protein [Clostridia bacterium]